MTGACLMACRRPTQAAAHGAGLDISPRRGTLNTSQGRDC